MLGNFLRRANTELTRKSFDPNCLHKSNHQQNITSSSLPPKRTISNKNNDDSRIKAMRQDRQVFLETRKQKLSRIRAKLKKMEKEVFARMEKLQQQLEKIKKKATRKKDDDEEYK